MQKLELLLPAGNLEVLKTAITYGADAVYIGGDNFSLRAKAKNFDLEAMNEAVNYAHDNNVRLYVTANISAHNYDLDEAEKYFKELERLKIDGVIISDMGMFRLAKKNCPSIPIHISTQANSTNYETFNFWKELGATRVVAARELSLKEIKEISDNIPKDMEIEAFMHGAMCMSYSGRCLLSNYMVGRDANRGECTHPCRWKYSLVEEQRPNEYYPVYENERGTYIFNSKDLCMIDKIPDLINAGVMSFKVEGRMKTALYVATVARAYRKGIDAYLNSEAEYNQIVPKLIEEIKGCTYRSFTRGFYYGKPNEESQIYDNNTYEKGSTYIGNIIDVDSDGFAYFQQKNKFSLGDNIALMVPNSDDIILKVLKIYNAETNEEMDNAPHPSQMLKVKFDKPVKKDYILRTPL